MSVKKNMHRCYYCNQSKHVINFITSKKYLQNKNKNKYRNMYGI